MVRSFFLFLVLTVIGNFPSIHPHICISLVPLRNGTVQEYTMCILCCVTYSLTLGYFACGKNTKYYFLACILTRSISTINQSLEIRKNWWRWCSIGGDLISYCDIHFESDGTPPEEKLFSLYCFLIIFYSLRDSETRLSSSHHSLSLAFTY